MFIAQDNDIRSIMSEFQASNLEGGLVETVIKIAHNYYYYDSSFEEKNLFQHRKLVKQQ